MLTSQSVIKEELILYSDQASRFIFRAFIEFDASVHIKQRMIRAGFPYANVPIESYFHILKIELIYLYEYDTKEFLFQTIEEFAYLEYNYIRPHSYHEYLA